MKIMSFVKGLAVGSAALLFAAASMAEVAVVVHPSNNAALDNKEIERLFLHKSKSFPGGGQALPINQPEGSSIRDAFDSGLLGKSSSQMKAYWSKLVFTGQGTPPQEAASDAAVKELVSGNPATIGYIDGSAVDSSVKVVHRF